MAIRLRTAQAEARPDPAPLDGGNGADARTAPPPPPRTETDAERERRRRIDVLTLMAQLFGRTENQIEDELRALFRNPQTPFPTDPRDGDPLDWLEHFTAQQKETGYLFSVPDNDRIYDILIDREKITSCVNNERLTAETALAMAMLAKGNPAFAGGVYIEGTPEERLKLTIVLQLCGVVVLNPEQETPQNTATANSFRAELQTAQLALARAMKIERPASAATEPPPPAATESPPPAATEPPPPAADQTEPRENDPAAQDRAGRDAAEETSAGATNATAGNLADTTHSPPMTIPGAVDDRPAAAPVEQTPWDRLSGEERALILADERKKLDNTDTGPATESETAAAKLLWNSKSDEDRAERLRHLAEGVGTAAEGPFADDPDTVTTTPPSPETRDIPEPVLKQKIKDALGERKQNAGSDLAAIGDADDEDYNRWWNALGEDEKREILTQTGLTDPYVAPPSAPEQKSAAVASDKEADPAKADPATADPATVKSVAFAELAPEHRDDVLRTLGNVYARKKGEADEDYIERLGREWDKNPEDMRRNVLAEKDEARAKVAEAERPYRWENLEEDDRTRLVFHILNVEKQAIPSENLGEVWNRTPVEGRGHYLELVRDNPQVREIFDLAWENQSPDMRAYYESHALLRYPGYDKASPQQRADHWNKGPVDLRRGWIKSFEREKAHVQNLSTPKFEGLTTSFTGSMPANIQFSPQGGIVVDPANVRFSPLDGVKQLALDSDGSSAALSSGEILHPLVRNSMLTRLRSVDREDIEAAYDAAVAEWGTYDEKSQTVMLLRLGLEKDKIVVENDGCRWNDLTAEQRKIFGRGLTPPTLLPEIAEAEWLKKSLEERKAEILVLTAAAEAERNAAAEDESIRSAQGLVSEELLTKIANNSAGAPASPLKISGKFNLVSVPSPHSRRLHAKLTRVFETHGVKLDAKRIQKTANVVKNREEYKRIRQIVLEQAAATFDETGKRTVSIRELAKAAKIGTRRAIAHLWTLEAEGIIKYDAKKRVREVVVTPEGEILRKPKARRGSAAGRARTPRQTDSSNPGPGA